MIRSLRRKFILIAMASLIGTMAVLCAAIGAGNYYVTTNRMDKAIFLLRQNGGTFLAPGSSSDPFDFHFQVTPETAFETRYFIVELTAQQEKSGRRIWSISPRWTARRWWTPSAGS